MSVAKKPGGQREPLLEERAPLMCDNHPDREAVHTTGAVMHQPISLCGDCLAPVDHLRQR